jgi:hypothetical protein
MNRMPKGGERVRFPRQEFSANAITEQIVTVHHIENNVRGSVFVYCEYPSGCIMPFIGRFADGSLNSYAEIIE